MFSDSDSQGGDFGRLEDFDSDAASGDDDITVRRRRRKEHRREREARGGVDDDASGDNASEAGDDASAPEAASAPADTGAFGDDDDDGIPAAPSASAPHLEALLKLMTPFETVHQTIARLGTAKTEAHARQGPGGVKGPQGGGKAAIERAEASLQAAMSATEELMTAFKDNDIHEATREHLLLRLFKALRRKPDPLWMLRWLPPAPKTPGQVPEPLRPGETAAAAGWLGPFSVDQMDAWRAQGFFTRKAGAVWNINAMPKAQPVLAASVEFFSPAAKAAKAEAQAAEAGAAAAASEPAGESAA